MAAIDYVRVGRKLFTDSEFGCDDCDHTEPFLGSNHGGPPPLRQRDSREYVFHMDELDRELQKEYSYLRSRLKSAGATLNPHSTSPMVSARSSIVSPQHATNHSSYFVEFPAPGPGLIARPSSAMPVRPVPAPKPTPPVPGPGTKPAIGPAPTPTPTPTVPQPHQPSTPRRDDVVIAPFPVVPPVNPPNPNSNSKPGPSPRPSVPGGAVPSVEERRPSIRCLDEVISARRETYPAPKLAGPWLGLLLIAPPDGKCTYPSFLLLDAAAGLSLERRAAYPWPSVDSTDWPGLDLLGGGGREHHHQHQHHQCTYGRYLLLESAASQTQRRHTFITPSPTPLEGPFIGLQLLAQTPTRSEVPSFLLHLAAPEAYPFTPKPGSPLAPPSGETAGLHLLLMASDRIKLPSVHLLVSPGDHLSLVMDIANEEHNDLLGGLRLVRQCIDLHGYGN